MAKELATTARDVRCTPLGSWKLLSIRRRRRAAPKLYISSLMAEYNNSLFLQYELVHFRPGRVYRNALKCGEAQVSRKFLSRNSIPYTPSNEEYYYINFKA